MRSLYSKLESNLCLSPDIAEDIGKQQAKTLLHFDEHYTIDLGYE